VSFVQLEFVGFLAIVWTLYWWRPGRTWQNAVLLVASALFYGWLSPWWVLVLYGSAGVDFSMGQLMRRSRGHRHIWLAISLCTNLGLLAWFKYFGFFVENVSALLVALGSQAHQPTLQILLPAGISFYTFQTMSYTIDVYRGELKPRKNLLDYVVFVSFFPQLMAGPIERASRLLPQLEQPRRYAASDQASGLQLALYGAFKKLVIADTLAPYVDTVFLLEAPSTPLLMGATAGFMVQIYADFSGYTDIARGTARMLGVDLVKNFDEPYLAASTPEFWQRWHISLSSWIRDYLLAPLLGQAPIITPARFAFAITVTMVVMGAWHGAGWNFIVFGLFHAFAILAYVTAGRLLPAWVAGIRGARPVAILFHLVVVGGLGALLFREPSLARVVQYLTQPPLTATDDEWRATVVMFALVTVLNLPLLLEHIARRAVPARVYEGPWAPVLRSTLVAVLLIGIGLSHRPTAYDFIYFRF
jgi:alginate O-acetyltransferase complex protein AlgI